MGRTARPPGILVPCASRRPLGEIAGHPLPPAGPSARALSERVWRSLRNTSPPPSRNEEYASVHGGVGRRPAVHRHNPPIRLEHGIRTSVHEHGPVVRQPRHAGHVDHFRRDRSNTGAAAGGDADADRSVRDGREPETIGGNPATSRASLQELRFTAKRRHLVHIRTRIVAGGENDPGVVQ